MTTRVRTREWSSTDYYAVLGVRTGREPAPRSTPRTESWRRRSIPDRNADPVDQERFKQISAAYAALKDPTTRRGLRRVPGPGGRGHPRTCPPRRRPHEPAPRRVDHLAPSRRPPVRPPMAAWLRTTIAAVLVVLGLAVAVWVAVGDLPAPTDADTPIAVQVTLAIVALKFVVCGAAVAWYPQLRARWHH